MKRARPALALHDAVQKYDLAGMKSLIEAGASLTEIDDDGSTPLHLAVVGPPDAVQAMLSILLSSVDEDERLEAITAHDDDGMTPLHLATRCSNSNVVDFMLCSIDEEVRGDVLDYKTQRKGSLWNGDWGKKKADGSLDELDTEHMTIFHLALERLDPSAGDDDDDDDSDDDAEPLSDAARAEGVAMVRLLIEHGADVNARDADARTPFHQAVDAGLHDVVEMLLEAGADPSLGCKAYGVANTALHQAVVRGDEGMVRLLIRAAPHLDVDAAGQNGLTPLCLAARSNKEACAKALLDGGADPNKVTSFGGGKSALDIAKTNKRTGILKLFGVAVDA